MKLKSILYMLMVLPCLWSCNNEDDVEEIFASGTWYVVDFYGKVNWDKRNGEPKYNTMLRSDDPAIRAEGNRALEIISKFSLAFKTDGTITGGMQNGEFTGTWQADGNDRTVHITINGKPNTSPAHNKEFIDALTNARFYQGDSNYLMLAPEDKKSFIQLKHN